MGLFDKAKDLAASNKDKIKDGIDRGAELVRGKAGGHADKVDRGATMAKDALDKLDDGNDGVAGDESSKGNESSDGSQPNDGDDGAG